MTDMMLAKWGKRVAERGFAQVPNYLLELNRFVDEEHKLNATESIILIHLVASWWKKDEMPFPSMRTLSERSGVSERQVQRALKSLEAKGFFRKERKRVKTVISSNVYDLTPLVKILDEIAEHFGNAHPRRMRQSTTSEGPIRGKADEQSLIAGTNAMPARQGPATRRMRFREPPAASSEDGSPGLVKISGSGS